MSYQYEHDCDYELTEENVRSFIHINYANKQLILNLLKEYNIMKVLFLPDKMQVDIRYIKYENNIVEVDYYDMYHQVLQLITKYDTLNYNDKQKLANLIHYSNILLS
jgi:hypothetical protein